MNDTSNRVAYCMFFGWWTMKQKKINHVDFFRTP